MPFSCIWQFIIRKFIQLIQYIIFFFFINFAYYFKTTSIGD